VLDTLAILSSNTEAQRRPHFVHDGADLRAQLFSRHIETNSLVAASDIETHA
jgi:hypothetical protein